MASPPFFLARCAAMPELPPFRGSELMEGFDMSNRGNIVQALAVAAVAGLAGFGISHYGRPSQGVEFDEERLRSIVAEAVASNPGAIIASIEAHVQSQQAEQARAADEQVLAVADRITDNATYPVVGNPDGPVEVVYFFDVNCSFCKRLEPVIKKVVEENPDVRLSHREIPILSPTSQLAAFLQAVVWDLHPDRYEELHDAFIGFGRTLGESDVQTIVNGIFGKEEGARLLSLTSKVGSDPIADAAADRVQANLDLMRVAGISGTPFVFVPGAEGIIRGAGDDAYETLTAYVEQARRSVD